VHASHRHLNEQAFHDQQAWRRSRAWARQPGLLLVADDAYLDHETWIRPAMQQLGDVRDRRVLDYGCGHGMAAVVLARRGARVTACDLSSGYLHEARQRARANGVSLDLVLADAQRLPFADASFDRIWGNAILHHLDMASASREIARILAPGGVAVFCEPWGENPLLNWARQRLPYPSKNRTVDEQPLRQCHVRKLRAIFPGIEVRGFQLMSMAGRVLRRNRLLTGLDRCDDWVLRRVPALQRFCRYVVLVLRQPCVR
jgi:SAM-dependent methyltransferase